jgi:hypothetical protein
MEKYLAILVLGLLLLGCTGLSSPPTAQAPGANQTPTINQTPTPPANNTLLPPANGTLNKTQSHAPFATTDDVISMFNCGKLESYEYKMTDMTSNTTEGGTTPDISYYTYNISSDTVNGTAAWLYTIGYTQSSGVPLSNGSGTYEVWFSKATSQCLKVSSGEYFGCMNVETCASTILVAIPGVPLAHLGNESVTVPAGTFLCNKYTGGIFTYWISKDVPIPVKMSYSLVKSAYTLELVNYSA